MRFSVVHHGGCLGRGRRWRSGLGSGGGKWDVGLDGQFDAGREQDANLEQPRWGSNERSVTLGCCAKRPRDPRLPRLSLFPVRIGVRRVKDERLNRVELQCVNAGAFEEPVSKLLMFAWYL